MRMGDGEESKARASSDADKMQRTHCTSGDKMQRTQRREAAAEMHPLSSSARNRIWPEMIRSVLSFDSRKMMVEKARFVKTETIRGEALTGEVGPHSSSKCSVG